MKGNRICRDVRKQNKARAGPQQRHQPPIQRRRESGAAPSREAETERSGRGLLARPRQARSGGLSAWRAQNRHREAANTSAFAPSRRAASSTSVPRCSSRRSQTLESAVAMEPQVRPGRRHSQTRAADVTSPPPPPPPLLPVSAGLHGPLPPHRAWRRQPRAWWPGVLEHVQLVGSALAVVAAAWARACP
jgi:hypothetical protein